MSITITPEDIAAIAPEFATSLIAVTEVQGLTFSAIPDAGIFKLAFSDVETDEIDFDADDDAIQAALRLIPGLEDVTVFGDYVDGFSVTFNGVDGNLSLIIASDSTLTYTSGEDTLNVQIEVGVITNGNYPADLDVVVDLAREFVCEAKWGNDAKAKKAICLMTAHLLKDLGFGAGNSGSPNVSGPIIAERVGDLSRSYGQTSLGSGASASEQMLITTKYGKTFLMLRKTLVTTPIVV